MVAGGRPLLCQLSELFLEMAHRVSLAFFLRDISLIARFKKHSSTLMKGLRSIAPFVIGCMFECA